MTEDWPGDKIPPPPKRSKLEISIREQADTLMNDWEICFDNKANLYKMFVTTICYARLAQAKQDLEDLEEQGDSLRYFAKELITNHKLGNRVIKDENTRKKYIDDFCKSAEGIEGMYSFMETRISELKELAKTYE